MRAGGAAGRAGTAFKDRLRCARWVSIRARLTTTAGPRGAWCSLLVPARSRRRVALWHRDREAQAVRAVKTMIFVVAEERGDLLRVWDIMAARLGADTEHGPWRLAAGLPGAACRDRGNRGRRFRHLRRGGRLRPAVKHGCSAASVSTRRGKLSARIRRARPLSLRRRFASSSLRSGHGIPALHARLGGRTPLDWRFHVAGSQTSTSRLRYLRGNRGLTAVCGAERLRRLLDGPLSDGHDHRVAGAGRARPPRVGRDGDREASVWREGVDLASRAGQQSIGSGRRPVRPDRCVGPDHQSL